MTKQSIANVIEKTVHPSKVPTAELGMENTLTDVVENLNTVSKNSDALAHGFYLKEEGSIVLDNKSEFYYDLYSNTGILVNGTLEVSAEGELLVQDKAEVKGSLYLTNTINPVIAVSGTCSLANVESGNTNTRFLYANTGYISNTINFTNTNPRANVIVATTGIAVFDTAKSNTANTIDLHVTRDAFISNTLYLTDSDVGATPLVAEKGTCKFNDIFTKSANANTFYANTIGANTTTPNTSYAIDANGIINATEYYRAGKSIYSPDQTFDSITFEKTGNTKGIFFSNNKANVGIISSGTNIQFIDKNAANANIITVHTKTEGLSLSSNGTVRVIGDIQVYNTTPTISSNTGFIKLTEKVSINAASSNYNLNVGGTVNANSYFINGISVSDNLVTKLVRTDDIFVAGNNVKEKLVTGNVTFNKTGVAGSGLVFAGGMNVYETGEELIIADKDTNNQVKINVQSSTITSTANVNIPSLNVGSLYFSGVKFASGEGKYDSIQLSDMIKFSGGTLNVAGVGATSSPSLIVKENNNTPIDDNVRVSKNLYVEGNIKLGGSLTGNVSNITIKDASLPKIILNKTNVNQTAEMSLNSEQRVEFNKDVKAPNYYIDSSPITDYITNYITKEGNLGSKITLSSGSGSSSRLILDAANKLTFVNSSKTSNIEFGLDGTLKVDSDNFSAKKITTTDLYIVDKSIADYVKNNIQTEGNLGDTVVAKSGTAKVSLVTSGKASLSYQKGTDSADLSFTDGKIAATVPIKATSFFVGDVEANIKIGNQSKKLNETFSDIIGIGNLSFTGYANGSSTSIGQNTIFSNIIESKGNNVWNGDKTKSLKIYNATNYWHILNDDSTSLPINISANNSVTGNFHFQVGEKYCTSKYALLVGTTDSFGVRSLDEGEVFGTRFTFGNSNMTIKKGERSGVLSISHINRPDNPVMKMTSTEIDSINNYPQTTEFNSDITISGRGRKIRGEFAGDENSRTMFQALNTTEEIHPVTALSLIPGPVVVANSWSNITRARTRIDLFNQIDISTAAHRVGIALTGERFKIQSTRYGSNSTSLYSLPISIETDDFDDITTTYEGVWINGNKDKTKIGYVGVGTTTPVYRLDVNGKVNSAGFLVNGIEVMTTGTSITIGDATITAGSTTTTKTITGMSSIGTASLSLGMTTNQSNPPSTYDSSGVATMYIYKPTTGIPKLMVKIGTTTYSVTLS